MDRGRNADFPSGRLDMFNCGSERSAGSKIEGERDCRKDAQVIDGKSGVGRLVMGKGAEGDEVATSPRHIDGLESVRALLSAGHDFQDDVILIETLIHVGDL